MKRFIAAALVAGGMLVGSASSASAAPITTITFDEGLTSPSQPGGTAVGSYYSALGMVSPNLRFHDSTYSGNVPFAFTDGWGAIIDSGINVPGVGTGIGVVNFLSPVDFVEISGTAQAAFDLNGAEPYSWTINAYDSSGALVSSASESFGYDFTTTTNDATNPQPYPLANLLLRVDAVGQIYSLQIIQGRKTGLDTIAFSLTPSPVPLPAGVWLLLSALGGLGFAGWRRKRAVAA